MTIYWRARENTYVCRAGFYRDYGGGFTVVARNLPGCISEGETIEEASANIQEAFRLCIESYLASGTPIPWDDASSATEGKPDCVMHFAVEVNP